WRILRWHPAESSDTGSRRSGAGSVVAATPVWYKKAGLRAGGGTGRADEQTDRDADEQQLRVRNQEARSAHPGRLLGRMVWSLPDGGPRPRGSGGDLWRQGACRQGERRRRK